MNLMRLSELGKVGGIPGVALGAAVLVLGAVLGLTDAIPEAWRGPLLILVVLGAVSLAMLALAGWMRSSRAGAQTAISKGGRSEARNEDSSGRGGGRQEATTRGNDSPAINVRRSRDV